MKNIKLQDYEGNPIIKAPFPEWIIANLTVLNPWVGDLKRCAGQVRIYYNAHNGWLTGRESIGLATIE